MCSAGCRCEQCFLESSYGELWAEPAHACLSGRHEDVTPPHGDEAALEGWSRASLAKKRSVGPRALAEQPRRDGGAWGGGAQCAGG